MLGCLKSVRFRIISEQSRQLSMKRNHKNGYDMNRNKRNNYVQTPRLQQPQSRLYEHQQFENTDEARIQELERYRISARHLASIMGENPKNFKYDDQVAAMKYLMPGYVMYAEACPKLEHPHEFMGQYRNPETLAAKQNMRVNSGRPDHYLYFNEDITLIDSLEKLNEIFDFLKNEAARIERDFSTGTIDAYPAEYKKRLSNAKIVAEFESPARFLGFESLPKAFTQKFQSKLRHISMLPTSYLAQDLLDKFSVAKKEGISYSDDFYAVQVPEIEVLGEKLENKWVSSALCIPAGSGQVNVTLVGDGNGKFDINGVPLHEFFDGKPSWMMAALKPLTILQKLNDFDAVISVVGTGGGEMAIRRPRGRDMKRWSYGVESVYHLPNRGAMPRHGFDEEHDSAIIRGGGKQARAISQGIAIAIVPFVSPEEAKTLKHLGLQQHDFRRKEREWKAGAGAGRLSGRRPKRMESGRWSRKTEW